MAKRTCNFHSSKAAMWHCEDCARDYCGDCVIHIADARARTPLPPCALCSAPLDYLGSGNEAPPFWSVAHRFFGYPFSANGLIMLGVIAFASLFMNFGLFGLVAGLFIAATVLKYGLAVLEAVAQGAKTAPNVGDALSKDEDHLFLQFVAMLFIVGFAGGALSVLVHPSLGTLFTLLVSFFTPGMFVYLAVDRRISSALNPAKLLSLALMIGWPYLLVVFLSNVISTGPLFMISLMGEDLLKSAIAVPLIVATFGYFSIVYFALLGYVLYENQTELGYVAGDPTDQVVADSVDNRRRQVLADANVLLKEDRADDALDRLAKESKAFAQDPVFLERYLTLALELGKVEHAPRAAESLITYLVGRDAPDQALDRWRAVSEVDPTFLPSSPNSRHALARAAHQRNLNSAAYALLRTLHIDFPDYDEMVPAYELLATVLRDRNAPEQAAKVERFVKQWQAARAKAAPKTTPPTTKANSESKPSVSVVAKDAAPSSWKVMD